MDAGRGTPFLDIFRRGGVDRDIRLLAAQGELGLRPDEHRILLELLAGDADPQIAKIAEATLRTDLAARAAEVARPG